MTEPPDDPMPTRKSLLTRLKNWEDQEGWREFFDTYWRLVYGTALEAGLTEDEAEEVVQETIITVAKRFKEGKYEHDPKIGSFKGWLLNTTRWRIQDQFRKRLSAGPVRKNARRDPTKTPTTDRVPDPASLHLDTIWERNLTHAAMGRVKQRVDPKLFQIFHLLVVREWPARKVAEKLHAHLAQVYYAKHKVSALVKKENQTAGDERSLKCGFLTGNRETPLERRLSRLRPEFGHSGEPVQDHLAFTRRLLCRSSRFSLEPVQPGGRQRIAQRFIAGRWAERGAQSRRDDRTRWLERDTIFGEFLPSLRDSPFFPGLSPAMNRWAIFGRPVGTSLNGHGVLAPRR